MILHNQIALSLTSIYQITHNLGTTRDLNFRPQNKCFTTFLHIHSNFTLKWMHYCTLLHCYDKKHGLLIIQKQKNLIKLTFFSVVVSFSHNTAAVDSFFIFSFFTFSSSSGIKAAAHIFSSYLWYKTENLKLIPNILLQRVEERTSHIFCVCLLVDER